MSDVTPPPAPAPTPVWEDFIDIFLSPTKVFERRKDDPTFFVPWLVFIVLSAVIMIAGWSLLEPAYRADSLRGVERYIASHPDLPANVVEQMRSGRGPGSGLTKYFAPVGAGVAVLLVGFVTWVTGKIVGAKTSLAQAFMVSAYSYLPRLLGTLVAVVLALVLPDTMLNTAMHLQLGPALAFDPGATKLTTMALVARLEIFTLWTTVLIALGLRVTGGIDKSKAVLAGVIAWVIGAILPLAGAAMAG
ncbi:MAG TPA: YIP1 family protein [Gemmatimonadales bacterium]|nr:YIP1 family protein [Gemmatimonadales bacterium]